MAEAEEDEIETPVLAERPAKVDGVSFGGGFRRILAAHAQHIALRDRHPVEQRDLRHMVVAAGVARRDAAFVAEEHMHAGPVDRGRGQALIDRARRVAAGKREGEAAALGDRLGRRRGDGVGRSRDKRGEVRVGDRLGDRAVGGGDG